VASDLLDLLLPIQRHHKISHLKLSERAMSPIALLPHPSKWKSLASQWQRWESDMSDGSRDQGSAEGRKREEQESDEEEGVESGLCRRLGCGKVSAEIKVPASGFTPKP
jgi:hypothetical protein